MTVIALTHEMGSLAKDVAEQIGRDLGLRVMRHEVVDQVSSRMHVPTSLINRLREGKAGALERLRADRASLAVYINEEVLDVAAGGDVVLRGWGATCLLRTVPHVVCVRVTRPAPLATVTSTARVASSARSAARTRASSARSRSIARDASVSANSGRRDSAAICPAQLSTETRPVLRTRS